jgi:hypothetical protein
MRRGHGRTTFDGAPAASVHISVFLYALVRIYMGILLYTAKTSDGLEVGMGPPAELKQAHPTPSLPSPLLRIDRATCLVPLVSHEIASGPPRPKRSSVVERRQIRLRAPAGAYIPNILSPAGPTSPRRRARSSEAQSRKTKRQARRCGGERVENLLGRARRQRVLS